jgi:hypothetical protein
MKKIEKTKENIGVSGLDSQTRKKLFNEFVEAGGEIIKEKDDRGLSDYDRDLQIRYKRQLENLRNQQSAQDNARSELRKQSGSTLQSGKQKNPAASTQNYRELSSFQLFFQRINIKFRLFFMKVTDLSGYYFIPDFLRNFDETYKSALISMQITYFSIFKQNLRTGHRIIDSLDKMHPIYFELIDLLSNVFDRTISNQILEHFYNFQDVPQETTELQGPFTELFSKLFPLYQYKELIMTGLERALTLQMRIEKKKFTFFSAGKKKIKNDINIIFNKLYPRLYWLMCRYEGRIFWSDKDIKDNIAIPPEFFTGKRKKTNQNDYQYSFSENTLSKENTIEEELKEDIPEAVETGLELMKRTDPEKSQDFLLRNKVFKSINKNDTIFTVNLLFNEFEREYSFILTTNKIKFNTISRSYENQDFKTRFINIYNEIGKCKNRLKDYAVILDAFEKLKSEQPISSTQYIEYSNRLTALEKEKNQTGSEARGYIRSFMEKLSKELKVLIDDMELAGNIVANPQDVIYFESEIEGDKILNEKSVIDAITYTYNFSSAFVYRLSQDGDLTGRIDSENLDGQEKNKQNSGEKTVSAESNKPADKTNAKKKNILKELDDLL